MYITPFTPTSTYLCPCIHIYIHTYTNRLWTSQPLTLLSLYIINFGFCFVLLLLLFFIYIAIVLLLLTVSFLKHKMSTFCCCCYFYCVLIFYFADYLVNKLHLLTFIVFNDEIDRFEILINFIFSVFYFKCFLFSFLNTWKSPFSLFSLSLNVINNESVFKTKNLKYLFKLFVKLTNNWQTRNNHPIYGQ